MLGLQSTHRETNENWLFPDALAACVTVAFWLELSAPVLGKWASNRVAFIWIYKLKQSAG